MVKLTVTVNSTDRHLFQDVPETINPQITGINGLSRI